MSWRRLYGWWLWAVGAAAMVGAVAHAATDSGDDLSGAARALLLTLATWVIWLVRTESSPARELHVLAELAVIVLAVRTVSLCASGSEWRLTAGYTLAMAFWASLIRDRGRSRRREGR